MIHGLPLPEETMHEVCQLSRKLLSRWHRPNLAADMPLGSLRTRVTTETVHLNRAASDDGCGQVPKNVQRR